MPANDSFSRAFVLAFGFCILPLGCAACCGGDETCIGTLEWKGETYKVEGKGAYAAIEDGCKQHCAKHDAANKGCVRECTSSAGAAMPFPLHADCN